jgi:hypothetical protein
MTVQHLAPPLRADAIAALLTKEIKPVLLLGAGASFKSGIPLAGMLVDAIARFAFCKAQNRSPDDPTLMRSDWIRWLEQQPWFRTDAQPADLCPSAVEYLLLSVIARWCRDPQATAARPPPHGARWPCRR